jgi:serine protease
MRSAIFVVVFFLIIPCSGCDGNHSLPADRYLSLNGHDHEGCTSSAQPCRTFSYVDRVAVAGDVVHVFPGTYHLTSSTCIVTNTPGVTWQADTPGGVTIDGGGNCLFLWHNGGKSGYIKVLGFEFTGVQVNASLNSFGVLLEGSEGNFEVAYNTFHDFGGPDAQLNFGAALSVAPWSNGNYTGRTCKVHDNIFYNIASGGSFLFNAYSIYAICGHAMGDADPWIYNNLIYNEGSVAINLWHAADHAHVYNNSIDRAYMGIMAGSGDQGAVQDALVDISNNIVSNSHYGIYAEDNNGSLLSPMSTFNNNLANHNLIDMAYNRGGTILSILSSFKASANISGDPLYVSPATGNYRLAVNSLAKGKGSQTSFTPSTDLAGCPRRKPPSIGAYEP